MPSEKSKYLKSRPPKKVVGEYPDEKEALFKSLAQKSTEELFEVVAQAYEHMTPEQRRYVFGKHLEKAQDIVFKGDRLLQEVEVFCEKSRKGDYYAPFEINSKNFMFIPPETNEWFARLGELLKMAGRLVEKGDYQHAVQAFESLYELIDDMEYGDEIVFGDEIGSWMIPVREEECVAWYLKAVAEVENAVGFTNTAVELLKRDRQNSFSLKVYKAAKAVASAEQIQALDAKIKILGLKTQSN